MKMPRNIIAYYPDLKLQKGDIQSKFIFKTKRNTRDLVVEVNVQTHRQMVENKMKLEWTICSINDCVSVNSCFKCSRYNHRYTECNSEETCPLCAENTNSKNPQNREQNTNCTNCMTYSKYNQNKSINEDHSSLDRKCPSMQAMIARYKQNTDY